jgi:Holliday junction resolvase RusA-like endonuclease
MKIVILGKPIAKKRPRFYRRGKGVGVYNDQETEEGRWIVLANTQIDGQVTEVGIHLDMTFILPRPKGHYGTGRNAGKLKPSAPLNPKGRPDIDNYIKFCMDCINGTGKVWKDDSQVVSLTAIKQYGENPKTVIEIIEAR